MKHVHFVCPSKTVLYPNMSQLMNQLGTQRSWEQRIGVKIGKRFLIFSSLLSITNSFQDICFLSLISRPFLSYAMISNQLSFQDSLRGQRLLQFADLFCYHCTSKLHPHHFIGDLSPYGTKFAQLPVSSIISKSFSSFFKKKFFKDAWFGITFVAFKLQLPSCNSRGCITAVID